MAWIDEMADLIAEEKAREAYNLFRERYPFLHTFEARRAHIAALRARPASVRTEAEIDAIHDRALAALESAMGRKPDRASDLMVRPAGAPARRRAGTSARQSS